MTNDEGTAVMYYLREGADAALAALFAPVCVSCRQVLDSPTRSPACETCWRNLRAFTPPLCLRCGEPLPASARRHACPVSGSALARCRALGWYDGVLRDLIQAVKYHQRRTLVARLAPLLAERADDLIGPETLVIPVPLHPWRQWTRGFNQADDLARALARHHPGAILAPALRRGRRTRPQSDLDAEARRVNVDGAFTLAGWTSQARCRWATRLAARRVVLVDDVMTTGATLEACAKVVRDAGAAEVSAVTLARVVSPGASDAQRG